MKNMMAFPEGAAGPGLFPAVKPELRRDMDALLLLIEKTFPVPARFRRGLASDVAELSRLLTSARGERSLSYLNRPPMLSAYLRYFLPWNLYRLCRLLPSLELPLAPGDRILDLGAGPLTFPIALWLCRPEFRKFSLEFHCQDLSRAALDAGKKLFTALSGGPCPWTIRVRGARQDPAEGKQALVAVLNMYNELFQSVSPGDGGGLYRLARSQGALLAAHAGKDGRILIVEPGIPRSGQCIALLRDVLAGMGHPPLSPCAHDGPCPFPGPVKDAGPRNPPGGPSHRSAEQRVEQRRSADLSAAAGNAVRGVGKGASKWCHFAFDTQDAPAALLRLSAAAGLPKERATLSFLLAGPARGEQSPAEQKRAGRNSTEQRQAGQGPAGQRPESGAPDPRSVPGVQGPRGASTVIGSHESLPPFPGNQGNLRPPVPIQLIVRIISDPFPVGAAQGSREWGRYGCAREGMTLVRGERGLVESLSPGVLIGAAFTGQRDSKSGALLCRPAGLNE